MESALDIEQPGALLDYLRAHKHIEKDETPDVRVLAGGVSNRTVLVERANGEAWVLKQALAKLRVKVDWFSSPARIGREALAIEYLSQLAPPHTITPLVFYDANVYVLAMRAVPQPHSNWRTLLLQGQLVPDHVEQFGRLLGTIHRNAFARAGELEPIFRDRSFFESLRLEPYYAYTATQVPASAAFYLALIADTRAQLLTLVHGDYSPKNILVHDNRLILLDHEVIHWGDPAFDLGFALTHLLSKAHHVARLRREFGDAAKLFWRAYLDALGGVERASALGPRAVRPLGNVEWTSALEVRAVRHTLGCLLARVAGRSPHDYWTDSERERQRALVPELMTRNISRMDDLVDTFVREL